MAAASASASSAGDVAASPTPALVAPPALAHMPVVARRDGKATVSIVVAVTPDGGIGLDGGLPWQLRTDMAFFKAVTTGEPPEGRKNAVVMGRRTWKGIPAKFRPLRHRVNVVLSRGDASEIRAADGIPDDVAVVPSLAAAVDSLRDRDDIESIHIIGGAAAFDEAMASGLADVLYVTEVVSPAFATDVSVAWPLGEGAPFKCTMRSPLALEGKASFSFTQWANTDTADAVPPAEAVPDFAYLDAAAAPGAAPLSGELAFEDPARTSIPDIGALAAAQAAGAHPEQQYLALIRDILCTGVRRGDRTGTGTLSKFGVQMRYSLRDGVLPLLTTKRVFWRGVAEELLWFVSGDTSARSLQEKGVRIWDGNGSREFLDKSGLSHREEGDLGPVYGFQWRHFGAEYKDMHADYTGKGVDQLVQVVDKIRNKPTDRRIILSAWNPAAIPEMALPPCHMMAQFFVANGELSCQMYQRSADMGLGVPFNIASYSLLTAMLAHVTGLKPGDFVHVIGDAHVYLNHIGPLRQQLTRAPRAFPTLRIARDVAEIDGFKYEDFVVEGYEPHKTIKMKMAV